MIQIKNIEISKAVKKYGQLVVIPLIQKNMNTFNFKTAEDVICLKTLIKNLNISPKHLEKSVFTPVLNKKNHHCLVIGIEKEKIESLSEIFRTIGGMTVREMAALKASSATILLPSNTGKAYDFQSLSEGLALGAYDGELCKSENTEIQEITVDIISTETVSLSTIMKGLAIGKAVNYARKLSALPSNIATPEFFAAEAKKLISDHRIEIKVIEQSDFEKRQLGGMEAVSRGSAHSAKFILIHYKGRQENAPTVGLMGKTITFDAGGISLKSPDQMADMKMDKSGGAVVLSLINLLSELNSNVNIIAAIPAMENLPDGKAYRPGDVLKMYNGKTVEIMNTDAEGRLVMADALSYLEKNYSPDFLVDIATLTGAVVVALGHSAAAIVGNNAKLIKEISTASAKTDEKIWKMPLWDSHKKALKSKIADMKNLGPAKQGGVSTAAAFLSNFIESTPWVHLDIAGTAWVPDDGPYHVKGATGFGVRLLQQFMENLSIKG